MSDIYWLIFFYFDDRITGYAYYIFAYAVIVLTTFKIFLT